MDNWYTIEKLFFSFLSENEIASWGARRKNRLRLPASITTPRLPKGEHAFRRKDDTLAARLNDKKQMLRTLVRKTDMGTMWENYKLSMTIKSV